MKTVFKAKSCAINSDILSEMFSSSDNAQMSYILQIKGSTSSNSWDTYKIRIALLDVKSLIFFFVEHFK